MDGDAGGHEKKVIRRTLTAAPTKGMRWRRTEMGVRTLMYAWAPVRGLVGFPELRQFPDEEEDGGPDETEDPDHDGQDDHAQSIAIPAPT